MVRLVQCNEQFFIPTEAHMYSKRAVVVLFRYTDKQGDTSVRTVCDNNIMLIMMMTTKIYSSYNIVGGGNIDGIHTCY